MNLRDAMHKLHTQDHFAAEMEKAMSIPPNPFGSRGADRKRGPIPQWTETVRASIAPEAGAKLRRIAMRRNVSFAAVIRQAVDAYLKANEEAWR